MYLVCWNHDCRQTYDAKQFKATDLNVKCDKCGGTVVSNSGKVQISGISTVVKTIDPNKRRKRTYKKRVDSGFGPGSGERETEVKTFLVDYHCDDCKEKVNYKDGNMLLSNPPKFKHSCSGCGKEYLFSIKYPYTKYK